MMNEVEFIIKIAILLIITIIIFMWIITYRKEGKKNE